MGFLTLMFPGVMHAAYSNLTYRNDHFLYVVNPNVYPEWRGTEEIWLYNGKEIKAPAELRVDGDDIPPLPEGIIRQMRPTWDYEAIARTIKERVASKLDREPGSVLIGYTETGAVVFEGVGMLGREVDLLAAARLTADALEQGVNDIILPVREIQPTMTIDPELVAMGITEVVTVGESNFAGSTWARKHNIKTGLSKFNGHIVPQGEVFSFNEQLGHVGNSTGYLKELVIKGDKTLPDYGGGLCQVSTTAYRGIWEYGFPIEQRRNHSYAVSYYSPQGTDATIYPPATDMKFTNDSPGALLLQTHFIPEENLAYFIYYGTRDDRKTDIIGPYTWGHVGPPADRTEYTTDIAPGSTRSVGKRVPGMKAAWFRTVQNKEEEDEIVESYFSQYQARPNYLQIGVAELPSELAKEPDWIASTDVQSPEPKRTTRRTPTSRRSTRRSPRRR